MIMEIGIVAGEIWRALEKKDNAAVKELAETLGRPMTLVLMRFSPLFLFI